MPETRRSVKRKRDAEAAQSLLPSIMSIVVQNGVIDAQGLGRIGQTCEEYRRYARSDEAWTALCLHQWPNTSSVPKQVIAEHGGYRVWFKHRMYSCPQPKFPVPRKLLPPSITANDIMLLVDLKYKGKSIYSDSITGEEISPLLKNGEMTLYVNLRDAPVVLGEVERWEYYDDDEQKGFGPCDYDGRKLTGTIQLIRLNNMETCCIYDTTEIAELTAPTASYVKGDPTKIDIKTRVHGYIDFGQGLHDRKKGLALKHSPEAGAIRNRFSAPFGFNMTPYLNIMPGKSIGNGKWELNVEVVSFDIEAVTYSGDLFDEDIRFDSEEEVKKHGVSLLHLLSEVRGLFLNP